jgi:hypothetical protein
MSLNFSSTFKECVAKSKNSWGIFFFFRAQIRAYELDKGKKGYKKWLRLNSYELLMSARKHPSIIE